MSLKEWRLKQLSSYSNYTFIKGNTEFNNPIYSELFMNSNYLLSNRIIKSDDDNLLYGVYQVEDKNIIINELYDSLDNDYSVSDIYVKPIIRLSSKTKIDLVDNKLEVKND